MVPFAIYMVAGVGLLVWGNGKSVGITGNVPTGAEDGIRTRHINFGNIVLLGINGCESEKSWPSVSLTYAELRLKW